MTAFRCLHLRWIRDVRDAISGRENASQLIQFNSHDVSVLVQVRHVIREGSDSHHAISDLSSVLRPQSDDADISSLERVQRSTFNPRTCIYCLWFYFSDVLASGLSQPVTLVLFGCPSVGPAGHCHVGRENSLGLGTGTALCGTTILLINCDFVSLMCREC